MALRSISSGGRAVAAVLAVSAALISGLLLFDGFTRTDGGADRRYP
jgi:hypothetical protein